MMFLAVLLMAAAASAQYDYYEGLCPPENSAVAAFRNLTDIRTPLHIPNIDKLMQDASYAKAEFIECLQEVDLPWKVTLDVNQTDLIVPFLDRCCPESLGNQCQYVDIVLQYMNYQGGICWIVCPEAYYLYRRCTCCSCLLAEDCPVVGRCVESDYETVAVVVYCPHIMYSDRFQRVAVRLPSSCRCQANCPTPETHPLPFNSAAEEKRLQRANVDNFNRYDNILAAQTGN